MEEYPSHMTKEAILKVLGQSISDVKNELSALKKTLGEKSPIKYDLVCEEKKADLIEVVNYHISQGWIPLGGIIIDHEGQGDDKKSYLQTIWRREVSDTDPFVLRPENRTEE